MEKKFNINFAPGVQIGSVHVSDNISSSHTNYYGRVVNTTVYGSNQTGPTNQPSNTQEPSGGCCEKSESSTEVLPHSLYETSCSSVQPLVTSQQVHQLRHGPVQSTESVEVSPHIRNETSTLNSCLNELASHQGNQFNHRPSQSQCPTVSYGNERFFSSESGFMPSRQLNHFDHRFVQSSESTDVFPCSRNENLSSNVGELGEHQRLDHRPTQNECSSVFYENEQSGQLRKSHPLECHPLQSRPATNQVISSTSNAIQRGISDNSQSIASASIVSMGEEDRNDTSDRYVATGYGYLSQATNDPDLEYPSSSSAGKEPKEDDEER